MPKEYISIEKEGKYLLPSEAAAILRRTPGTLRQWRHMGFGPEFRKVGGRVYYRNEDIISWMSGRVAIDDGLT